MQHEPAVREVDGFRDHDHQARGLLWLREASAHVDERVAREERQHQIRTTVSVPPDRTRRQDGLMVKSAADAVLFTENLFHSVASRFGELDGPEIAGLDVFAYVHFRAATDAQRRHATEIVA